jgi:putative nucleotidyltransferase with HDIG domain
VRDEYPETVRIVLSGQTEMQTALRTVSIAQEFLHKPSEPDVIKEAIMRAVTLQGELENDAIRRMIATVDTLPSPSSVVKKLNDCLMHQNVEIADVAAIASVDPAMTAKLLQLANSSFFGVARTISTVADAITLLGISTVRDLAAGSKLFEVLSTELPNEDVRALEDHSQHVAQVASNLFSDTRIAREAFSAAVLHDVGELLIAVGFPEEDAQIRRRMSEGESRIDIELELFGVTHASVGAHLLRLWGLPTSVVEAVAWHHRGPQHTPWEANAIHGCFVAELLVENGTDIDGLVPDGYLDALSFTGLSDRPAAR